MDQVRVDVAGWQERFGFGRNEKNRGEEFVVRAVSLR